MPDPMYRQIADGLQRDIETGKLAAGEQLPTELEISEAWGASRSTVRDAVKQLTTRGLVEARPGQGTFVRRKIPPVVTNLSATHDLGTGDEAQYYIDVRRQQRAPWSTVPRIEIQPATKLVARELCLSPGSQVVLRHQQRFVEDDAYSLQTSFYPMQLVTVRGASRLIEAADIGEGTVQYLCREFGIEQIGYRDVITVRPPESNEISFFRLPEDGHVAVFENFRTAYDQRGEPIRLTVTVYPADRNWFVINCTIQAARA
jgi:GntR family transcriptional regulator